MAPRGRKGKAAHPDTVRHWAITGLKAPSGKMVKLEAISVGNGVATNEAALFRFFRRIGGEAIPETPSPAASESHARAEKRLDALRM